MWCKTCRQDVPGVARGGSRPAACIRCGTALMHEAAPGVERLAEHGVELDQFDQVSALPPPLEGLDDDPLEHQALRSAQRLAARRMAPLRHGVDRPHPLPRGRHGRPREPHAAPSSAGGALAWLLLWNGLAALVCGGILLGWSSWGGRPELWSLGLPVAIGGQASLIAGLVWQLERMAQRNCAAANRLAEVDQQLLDLQHSTELLSARQSQPSQAFYTHVAEGASPHILLADLKGQLDLLAARLADR